MFNEAKWLEKGYRVEFSIIEPIIQMRVLNADPNYNGGAPILLIEGVLKKDGCSEWKTKSFLHFCHRDQILEFAELMAELHDWGIELFEEGIE